MPFAVALAYRPMPVLHTHAGTMPLWRRLQALADRALTPFTQLWMGFFTDARAALPDEALTQALTDSVLFAGEHVVLAAWEQTVEHPARQLLPLLVQDTATEAARLTLPTITATLGTTLTFQPGLPEVQHAIDAYVGLQIRDISATTLRTVRTVLREGWNTGQSVQTIARDLRTVLGLTPRQAGTIDRLRTRLEDAGQTAGQVQRAVDTATRVGLRRRALVVGRTESQAATMMGAQMSMEQVVRSGIVQEDQVRKLWKTAEDEATCPRCAPIPALNPDGVGIHEAFQTPEDGAVQLPPLHPNCRCDIDYEIVH